MNSQSRQSLLRSSSEREQQASIFGSYSNTNAFDAKASSNNNILKTSVEDLSIINRNKIYSEDRANPYITSFQQNNSNTSQIVENFECGSSPTGSRNRRNKAGDTVVRVDSRAARSIGNFGGSIHQRSHSNISAIDNCGTEKASPTGCKRISRNPSREGQFLTR